MAADADFMSNVIGQRKQDINNIASIMSDINDIAKDIAVETVQQGEKLVRLDQNIAEADNNAEAALG
jgi:t-SNARE complex subunit (syntaxin)